MLSGRRRLAKGTARILSGAAAGAAAGAVAGAVAHAASRIDACVVHVRLSCQRAVDAAGPDRPHTRDRPLD